MEPVTIGILIAIGIVIIMGVCWVSGFENRRRNKIQNDCTSRPNTRSYSKSSNRYNNDSDVIFFSSDSDYSGGGDSGGGCDGGSCGD